MQFLLKTLFLFFIFTHSARADYHLNLDSEVAKGYAAFGATFNSLLETDSSFVSFSQWNLSAHRSQSKLKDESLDEVITYHGTDGSAGIGLLWGSKLNSDFSIFSNSTSETQYRQAGLAIDLSLPLSEEWAVGMGYGNSGIRQKFSFLILNQNISRELELEQKEWNFLARYTHAKWLTVSVKGRSYSYSRSKTELQAAYSNRFLNYYVTDLISSISGLPQSSVSLSFLAILNTQWEMEAIFQRTHLIVDDSESKKNQLLAAYYFDNAVLSNLSLGFGVSQSETVSTKDNSLLLNLGCNF